MSRLTYVEVKVPGGWVMCFDVDWSNYHSPEINKVYGWLENGRGFVIRDFLDKEIDQLLDSEAILEAIIEKIGPICQDPR